MSMNVTIRNIDEKKYRLLKARAALMKMSVGELVSEAISFFLTQSEKKSVVPASKNPSFQDVPSFRFGKKNAKLSSEVDKTLYE